MINECNTSARASGVSKSEITENHKAGPPTMEKLYEQYNFLHNVIMNLTEQYELQKNEFSNMKKRLFNTELKMEEIKKCLWIFLEDDSDRYSEDFLREAKRLSGLTDSQLSKDVHFTSENDLTPSMSTFCNQKIDTRKEATSIKKDAMTQTEDECFPPASELAKKLHGEIEPIKSPATNAIERILPIDCDTTTRTLLSIASQKKMLAKHFRKKWNHQIDIRLEENEFKRSSVNSYLYVKLYGEGAICWTDNTVDFLIAATDIKLIDEMASLLNEFEVEDLGDVRNISDMEIRLNSDGIFCIKQSKYIDNLRMEFGLKDAQLSGIPMNTGYLKARKNTQPMPNNIKYKNLIVSLSDVAKKSRPDIAVSVMILSQFIEAPTKSDWKEAKRIVQYLKGTVNSELRLGQNKQSLDLIGYADANWNAGKNSNSGYLFLLCGSPISWASVRQNKLVKSSVDAESVALEEATRQGLRLQTLIKDLTGKDIQITMFEDNQKCLKLIDSQEFMSRIKNESTAVFQYCPSIEMMADMLTKPLNKNKLRELSEKYGLVFLKD